MFSLSVSAEELSRTIIGGDIVHTGRAEADTEARAVFMAEAQAVKSLVNECGVAHREIKMWGREVEKTASGYKAISKAGLTFEDCEYSKKASPERKKQLESKKLSQDQDMYNKYLEAKEASNQALDKIGASIDDTNKKIDNINRKLNSKQKVNTIVNNITINEGPVTRVVASRPDCKAQFQMAMHQANVLAEKNYPPGNMNGEAGYYFSQAQMIAQNCGK